MLHRVACVLICVVMTGLSSFAALGAQTIIAEGEQFAPQDENGWQATHQDQSWASHSYGGMWVTNGGVMAAPADSVGSVAVQQITVPEAGAYRVWCKYQAPPYFNFMHKIEVVQNGKTVFSHVYGAVDALRWWSFNGKTQQRQLWWFWGVDHDTTESPKTTAALAAGPAEVRLVTVKNAEPAGGPMVDFVALTTDPTEEFGIVRTLAELAMTSSNKLYLRFLNNSSAPAQLKLS